MKFYQYFIPRFPAWVPKVGHKIKVSEKWKWKFAYKKLKQVWVLIFRWKRNFRICTKGGNHPTFAHPPSSFGHRSGVIPKYSFIPERWRTTLERGTGSEWQERKTEWLDILDRSALFRHRLVLVSRTIRVVPTAFLSFLRTRPFLVSHRSKIKRSQNER